MGEERGSECRRLQRWKVFILAMWNFPRINSCLQLSCASTTRLAGFALRLCAVVRFSFLMDGKPAKPPKNRPWFKNCGLQWPDSPVFTTGPDAGASRDVDLAAMAYMHDAIGDLQPAFSFTSLHPHYLSATQFVFCWCICCVEVPVRGSSGSWYGKR